MATALATPFYLDTGFTKTEIGLIAKHAGLWPHGYRRFAGRGGWSSWASTVRCGVGGVQLVSILGFVVLDQVGANKAVLAGVIGFEALGVGLARRRLLPLLPVPPTPLIPPPNLPCLPAWPLCPAP